MTSKKFKYDTKNITRLEEDLERITKSYRFRVGDIAVETLQQPSLIFKQMKRLFGLFHEYTYSAALKKIKESIEVGQPTDPIRNLTPSSDIPIKRLLKLSKVASHRNHWKRMNFREKESNYEKTIQRRLKELSNLAENGLPEQEYCISSHVKGDKHGIAMVLHNALPLSINGYAVRSQHLIDEMREQKIDILAVLRTTRLDMPQPYHPIGTVTPDDDTLEAYINSYSRLIEKRLRKTPPQLVHAASNYITGLAAGFAARRLGIPFIYEVRGLWEITRASVQNGFETSLGYTVQKRLETQCAMMADRVIVISTPLANTLVARGVNRENIRIIPNGGKTTKDQHTKTRMKYRERFGVNKDDIVVGFIGSITPYEGLGTLLEAISIARSNGTPLKLVVVGSGPTRTTLESRASQLGLREHCRFLGEVTPSEAILLHSGLDIASYVRDSTPVARIVPPLKPLQAMSTGVATIVSDLPALVELVGGVNTKAARICPANSPNALADILSALAENNQERQELAAEGKNWVSENRNWAKLVQNLSNVYDEVLDL